MTDDFSANQKKSQKMTVYKEKKSLKKNGENQSFLSVLQVLL